MKISVISDLHLDISLDCPAHFANEESDVLIIAGDLCEAKHIKSKNVKKWLEHVSEHHDQIFYVLGNHEFYGNSLPDTQNDIAKHLPHNVRILNNEYVDIGNVRFIGSTLWTDFGNNNPVIKVSLSISMNDYHSIFADSLYRTKITPDIIYEEHLKSFKFIEKSVKTDKQCVVITHHAPSYESVNDIYRNPRYDKMSRGFYSDLDYFIYDNENISHWIHGHMHNFARYIIDKTEVICNPVGYHNHVYQEDTGYINNLVIDIN